MRLVAAFVASTVFVALPARAEEAVVVHLRADSEAVRILRVDGEGPREVCAGLCDLPLPRDGVYRIAGEGVPATRPFTLDDGGTDLTLRVDAGSSVQRGVGISTTVAGGLSLLFALGYGEVLALGNIDNDHPVSISKDPLFLGTLSAGLVAGVIGVAMLATSGTSVTTSHGISFSALSGSRSSSGRARFTLTPTGLLF